MEWVNFRRGILAPAMACIIAFFASNGQAQFWSNTFTNPSVSTVGGISYFQSEVRLEPCGRVTAHPDQEYNFKWYGNSFLASFLEGLDPNCFPLPGGDGYITNVTVVLGALPDGCYNVQVFQTRDIGNPYPTATLRVFSFCVTNTPGASTLSVLPRTNATKLNLAIAGVSGAKYVTESTTDFTNWVAVSTNINGPVNFSTSIQVTETNRFYRTRIISRPAVEEWYE